MSGLLSITVARHAGTWRLATALLLAASVCASLGQATNSAPAFPGPSDLGASLLRVVSALALVLALFFGGVWFFRHGQRWIWPQGPTPKLAVLEARSLGGRQAIYVVGYEQERMLIAASPAGVNFLSHLPPAGDAPPNAPTAQPVSFIQTMQSLLRKK